MDTKERHEVAQTRIENFAKFYKDHCRWCRSLLHWMEDKREVGMCYSPRARVYTRRGYCEKCAARIEISWSERAYT